MHWPPPCFKYRCCTKHPSYTVDANYRIASRIHDHMWDFSRHMTARFLWWHMKGHMAKGGWASTEIQVQTDVDYHRTPGSKKLVFTVWVTSRCQLVYKTQPPGGVDTQWSNDFRSIHQNKGKGCFFLYWALIRSVIRVYIWTILSK